MDISSTLQKILSSSKAGKSQKKGLAYRREVLSSVTVAKMTGFEGLLNLKFSFGWSIREKFYRHLAAQLDNGRPLTMAVEDFYVRLIRDNKRSKANVIGHFIKKLYDGNDLTTAMKGWVPFNEQLIISSGEKSKTLGKSLLLIIDSHKKIDNVLRVFRSSIKEPAMYLISLYGLLFTVGKWVMPALIKSLPKEKTTGLATSLYDLTDMAMSPWFPVPIAVLILLSIAIWISLPRWIGPNRVLAENYFPYSFYRNLQGYIWLVGFSSLSATGKANIDSIQEQLKYASPWLAERLSSIKRLMNNGWSLPDALDGKEVSYKFPHPDMIDDIRSMHEFPDFPEKMLKLTLQWSDEMQISTEESGKKFGGIFKGVMMIIILYVILAINDFTTQMGSAIN